MAVYINAQWASRQVETVDEFETRKEAVQMVKEYRIADPTGRYWISSRACKDWAAKS